LATVQINSKYYEGGDYVLAEVYVYDPLDQADTTLVASMSVKLYTKENVLLDTATLDSYKYGDEEKFNIYFVHPLDIDELTVNAVATLVDSTVLSGTSSVITVPEVYNSIFPLNTNLTPQGELIEENAYMSKRVNLVEPLYDKVVLDSRVALILCDVDFSEGEDYFKTGNSPIDYRGGGNRLLDSLSGSLAVFEQAVQVYPSTLDGIWLSEISGTNLLLNSTFLTASGLTFSQTKQSLILDVEYTEYIVSSVNYLTVRGRSSEPYTPTAVTWSVTSDSFSVSGNSDVVFSTFALGENGTTDTIVSDLTMYLNYYGASGYIYSVTGSFATTSILTNWTLLNLRDTTPASATSFSVSFVVGSFEGPDDFTTHILLPQVEYGIDPSSRIPTTDTIKSRLPDIISLPSIYNFEKEKGSFIITYVPHYFSMWGDRYIFDTRDPTGNYGYYAYHRASDSAFVFTVLMAGVPIVAPLVSPPETLNPYQEYTLKFSWSSAGLTIELDGEIIASLVASVPTLPTVNDILYVGEDYLRANQLFGEIVSFVVWRDITG